MKKLMEIQHPDDFPDINLALEEPDGLLAFGNILSPCIVSAAYERGIFPWYEQDQPILWWSPAQRAVIFPKNIKISKSLKKIIRNKGYRITFNHDFDAVIKNCAQIKRNNQHSTWITSKMIECYSQLHRLNIAHSIEIWLDNKLVGGLYGLIKHQIFCGESMFSKTTDASKVALVALASNARALDITLIDCQLMNPYLVTMGAIEKNRNWYKNYLQQHPSSSRQYAQAEIMIDWQNI